ncbi:MAG: HlyD family efflux transporter periplasmic adaptor subunit [Gemmatimonadetes bacterium]|nr:MAG: HlyD family efflux transporter periplasmic adaptor subunit [Gemmatimonadota bacterium]
MNTRLFYRNLPVGRKTHHMRNSILILAIWIGGCSSPDSTQTIEASGTIETTEVRVSTQISGQIDRLLVDEGDTVGVGDTLAIIDQTQLKLQQQQLQADIDLAEAQLRMLLNGARVEDIQQAQEQLKQAEAHLKLMQENLRRITELFESGSVSQQQKDDAETRFQVAQAQRDAAQQTVKKLQRFARPEEIEAAQAQLAKAKAGKALIDHRISEAFITAPLAGVVTHRPVEMGEVATPGLPLFTISELDPVEVVVFVTGKEVGRVRLGQQAVVHIDSYPHRAFEGQVTFIASQAEFTPKTIQTAAERVKLVYEVRLRVANPEGILKPGMPADVVLHAL